MYGLLRRINHYSLAIINNKKCFFGKRRKNFIRTITVIRPKPDGYRVASKFVVKLGYRRPKS